MSTMKIALAVSLMVVGVGTAAWKLQSRELAAVRTEKSKALGDGISISAETEGLDENRQTSSGATPLTPDERLELMDLRRKAAELTELRRRRALATDEHNALKARATELSNRMANPFPPGWKKRSEARRAGFETPENAWETMVWALQNRDTNVLFQSVVPEVQRVWVEQAKNEGSEFIWRIGEQIPLFKVESVISEESDAARMKVGFRPGGSTIEVEARRTAEGWKIRLM